MEYSLSVLLPVLNGQETLAATAGEILEILPELTPSFELVIIDDGSTDATVEIADELSRRYPQVIVVRHGKTSGAAESLRSGLSRSRGEIIFFRDENCGLEIGEIHKLWKAVEEHPLVFGRARQSSWSKWRHWIHPSEGAGFKMLHRRAVAELDTAFSDQASLVDALLRRGYRWHEVQMRDRRRASRHSRLAAARPGRRSGRGLAQGQNSAEKDSPRRPNYLSKLKEFAVGE